MSTGKVVRSALLAGLRAVRTGWNILGITVVMLIVVVMLLVVVRKSISGGDDTAERDDHPYRGLAWYRTYLAEYDASLQMEWAPYVYWRRRPMSGTTVNVESGGIRRTVQRASAGALVRRVFFMGGSTMWGTGQRDAFTIPSLVAASLATDSTANVVVTNFGETGYVFTQEVLQLEMLLRDGARPDVVVFYDGINDAASSSMSPRCGLPQNETRRAFEFALGRVLTQRTTRDVGSLMRTMRERLSIQPGGVPGSSRVDTTAIAHGIVDCYARTAAIVEALAGTYGFQALYFWQPTPASTPKPFTAFEAAVVDTSSTDPVHVMLRTLNRRAAASIDSAMQPIVGQRFRNLSGALRGDTATVWLDFIGHVTERANAVIAGAMVAPIQEALASRGASAASRP